MKRKILASFLLLVLIFTNYVYAYSREGGTALKDKASIFDESKIDSKYNARSRKLVLNKNITIRNSAGNVISKAFPGNNTGADTSSGNVYYELKLQPNATYNDKITFELKDAINYNNKFYNVKIVLNSIKTENNASNPIFRFKIGRLAEGTSNVLDTSDDARFDILIYIDPKNGKAEADIDYYVVDDDGKSVNINGVLELMDIDLNQGTVIKGFTANKNNTFVFPEISNDLKVVTSNGESYIYTTNSNNADVVESVVAYMLMENKNKFNFVFTWDEKSGGTNIIFTREYMILTDVVNGKISNSVYGLKYEDSKQISYQPNNATTQYLKSIKIDGKEVPITNNIKDKYTFNKFTKDYSILVEYADKCKVEFVSNCDTTVPTQYIIPGEKATEPAQPTKTGYTFGGWYTDANFTTKYNFDTVVNEDKKLYAKWTPSNANYTVRHYIEDENGTITKDGKKYKLDTSTNKNATVNSTVTENAKTTYTGYTAKNNSLSGTVKQDGSLKLDFYYDKNQYIINFDTKGGSPVPNSQTKKYEEKVDRPTDPTKNGNKFLYWYEIVNGEEVQYNFSTPVTENKTLIAKWQEVVPEDVYHNISYIIDGKQDNSVGNPERYKEGSTTPITLNNPTKDGYSFDGWYDNEALDGNTINPLDVTNKTADITLYGRWTKNKELNVNYTIRHYLEDENGTVTSEGKKYKLDDDATQIKQAENGSTVTENAKSYDGYEAKNKALKGIVTEDESLELDFYYNKKQYNITFDTKGGNPVPDSQIKKYGEKVNEPSQPTKDGYRFLYWYEIVDGKKVIYDFNNPVDSDKELVAEWEEIKIVPNDTEPETPTKQETPAKQDTTTVVQKVLPKTGKIGATLISVLAIAIAGLIFAIRYRKLKDIK